MLYSEIGSSGAMVAVQLACPPGHSMSYPLLRSEAPIEQFVLGVHSNNVTAVGLTFNC